MHWYIASIPFLLLSAFFVYQIIDERNDKMAIEDENEDLDSFQTEKDESPNDPRSDVIIVVKIELYLGESES